MWVKQEPTAGCCGDNWLDNNEGLTWGGIGKGADAKTVNRGLDLPGRGENRGNLREKETGK